MKFIEKEKKLQNDMTLIVGSEKALKTKEYEMEKRLQEKEQELQEKEKQLEKEFNPPITEPGEFSIVPTIAQVIMKELEMIGLKHQNNNLKGLALERERERKSWEAKCA